MPIVCEDLAEYRGRSGVTVDARVFRILLRHRAPITEQAKTELLWRDDGGHVKWGGIRA